MQTTTGEPLRSGLKFERYFLLMLGVLTALVVVGHLRPYASRGFVPDDFGAFYCGGKVVLHRQDPYRVGPMFVCQRALASVDRRWKAATDEGVNTAPLPPYAFVPLAALAAAPVRIAAVLFVLLLLASSAVTGYCLSRMSTLPPAVAFAAAFMGTTYGSTELGQLAPIAIAALAASALLLRLGRQRSAAMTASVALLQPQFALPAFAALFLFVPRTRVTIAAIGGIAVLCSFAALGLHGTIEYLSVLPAAARSELNAPFQYSLTWFVHAFGASGNAALIAGTLSYLACFAIALFILARSGKRAITTGAVVLLPAAFAVFGGTYVHTHQMSVAILAAIVLVPAAATLISPMVAAALIMLPYITTGLAGLATVPSLVLTVLIVWAMAYFTDRPFPFAVAVRSATVTAILIAVLIAVLVAVRPPRGISPTISIVTLHHSDALVSVENQHVNDTLARVDGTPPLYYMPLKIPMWAGVALTLWLSSWMLITQPNRRRTVRAPTAAFDVS